MQQVLQSLRTGATEVLDVPCPAMKAGHLLIRTRCSLVSAGTERMVLSFGKAGLLSKARQQPEKVRQALHKVRTDGLVPTWEAIRSRLDRPTPMGYCNVGTVMDVGPGVTEFQPGDRVVSNGHHAEVVSVPKTLCARIPDGVSDQEAAFAVMGAIALQGARLAEPTLGESFAVMGLGLVGLMAVQTLIANGCRVIGLDFNRHRLDMARGFGAETIDLGSVADPVAAAVRFSRGRGVDGVLVATATDSDDPIRHAAQMCRKRGRVILVGIAGLALNRSDFYEKELSFRVSCSYGPGRYDAEYEQRARDYPLPYVRWTEQRNFEAVLDLLAARRLSVAPLITHRFPLERAADAYSLLLSREPSLGVLLKYPGADDVSETTLRRRTVPLSSEPPNAQQPEGWLGSSAARPQPSAHDASGNERGSPARPAGGELRSTPATPAFPATPLRWLARIPLLGPAFRFASAPRDESSFAPAPLVGVIGAGNFATRVLIPALAKNGARLVSLASEGGLSAVHAGRKLGFEEATSDIERVLGRDIDAVVIATRHDTHAGLVARALAAGKHVFVEKPLAIDPAQLAEVERAYSAARLQARPVVMLGFNRRFAPHIITMRELLKTVDAPKSFMMTVNAGAIPADHWTQSAAEGGGRLTGEACHFVDLLRHLAGAPITSVQSTTLGDASRRALSDTATISLAFADGSIGTVHYFANGHRAFAKERLEVFCGERVLQLDNFRTLRGWGWPGFTSRTLWRQDKGHEAGVAAFLDALRTGRPSPIEWTEILDSTRATFAAVERETTRRHGELRNAA